jgi:hypothetical protein
MTRFGLVLVLAGATVLAAGGSANAQNTCKSDALQTFKNCKQSCWDDFTAAKLACRNIDPVCGSACVDGNRACRRGVESYLDTGVLPDNTVICSTTDTGGNTLYGTGGCDTVLQQARQACWAQFCAANQTCSSCGDQNITDHNACYECVDPAQIAAFTCRDTCRDNFRQNLTVLGMKKLCRKTLNTCIGNCPPIN